MNALNALIVIGYVALALVLLRFTHDARVRYTLALVFFVSACLRFFAGWIFTPCAHLALALIVTFGPTLTHCRRPNSTK